jgi:hypothetical protein
MKRSAVRRRRAYDAGMRFLLGTILVAVAVGPAIADEKWSINANDSTYSYVCGGSERLSLTGKGNVFTVSGDCESLEVKGSDNKVQIEAVGTISINGNNNDVRYTRALAGKKRPTIKLKGAANTVRRREPAPSDPAAAPR